jgi:hypothetical protein
MSRVLHYARSIAMASTPDSAAADLYGVAVWNVRWPLILLYPLSASFFWFAYLRLTEVISTRYLPHRYGRMNEFNRKCFRQNVLSGLHTCMSTVLLFSALLTDPTLHEATSRLYPCDSWLLYSDIAISLGYFSYALPTSVVMAKAGFPYGSKLMIAHHALVVGAQSTFLLTQYPSGYMAASGFLFELTNVFFVPHVLLLQLEGAGGAAQTCLGVMLVIVYTLARCVACTYLAAQSLGDLARFAPAHATAWLPALIGLGCFYGLLGISWWWYVTSILPALHTGLQGALGESYHHTCCPAPLRRWAWRHLSAEGRAQAASARQRFAALKELQAEMGSAGGDA